MQLFQAVATNLIGFHLRIRRDTGLVQMNLHAQGEPVKIWNTSGIWIPTSINLNLNLTVISVVVREKQVATKPVGNYSTLWALLSWYTIRLPSVVTMSLREFTGLVSRVAEHELAEVPLAGGEKGLLRLRKVMNKM